MNTISNETYQYGMYFLIYSIVLTGTVLFFNYADMTKSFSYSTIGFVLFSLLSLIVSGVYFSPSGRDRTANMTAAYVATGIITFAAVISAVFAFASPEETKHIGIAALIFAGLSIIIFLALFFYVFGSYLKQQRGILGFIVNFIFFIPCMLLDLIYYFRNQYNLSTRTEFILLFLETIFLIFYFFIFPKLNDYLSTGTTYILNNPVFLNNRKIALSDTSSFLIRQKDGSDVMPSNFSISMWIYLNVQTNNWTNTDGTSSEVNVFSYGNGKPKITYTNSTIDNQRRDMYMFYFTDAARKSNYSTSLPGQKWNNIVFNYHANQVDLFVNGALKTSFFFDTLNKIPVYSSSDSIVVGQDNGLVGAICNITYSKNILENHQIVAQYNLLMLKNPPLLQV